jgi:pyruvate,water dikinase
MTPVAGLELVLPMSAARTAVAAEFGSKAANLVRLANAGMPVPTGFCVSARAYESHLSGSSLAALVDSTIGAGQIASTDKRRSLLTNLRAAIVEAPVALELSREIEAAHRNLSADRVAVRSSATMEDLPGHSFAGLYDTMLGVGSASDVLTAVQNCWASLWTERAFDYRTKNGFDHKRARMAVVVQTLIEAEASGVLFTSDTVSGRNDQVIIEAVFGLGEGLVSGRISPDRVHLSRQNLHVAGYITGEKTIEIIANATGSRERAIDPVRAKSRSLDDETARKLGALGLQAEAALGGPQDVEWAVASGQIYILQSRPITTLVPPRSDEDRQIWSNLNTGEIMPDVVTPMTWSFIQPMVERIFDTLLGRFGFRLAGHPLAGLIAGRAYFNLNTFVGIMKSLPGFRDLDPIEMWGGKPGSGPHVPPEDVPGFDFRWSRLVGGLPSFVLWFLSHSTYRGLLFANSMRRKVKLMEAVDPTSLTESELALRLRALLARAEEEIGDAIAFAGGGAMYQTSLMTLCRQWLGEENGSLAHSLLAGQGNMESAEAGLAQWSLAVLAHEHPEVERTILNGADFRTVAEALRGVGGGVEFLATWSAFMDRHGHHARGEIELANPRWRETPDAILATVRGYMRAIGKVDPLTNHRESGAERRRLVAECNRRLRNPVKRLLFNFVVGNAQRGCLVRENVKSEAVRWIAWGRVLIYELGERFRRRGILEQAQDVFFLASEELEAVCQGKTDFDVRTTVAKRKAEYERNLDLRPPQVVVGRFDPDHFTPDDFDANASVFTGVAVSPGMATGPARVILRSDEDVHVLPGEILVAPFTDPGWTPYFLRAAGIVMDQGGLLSHGSIIAREYGIPAVVNVGPATKIIRTGQVVRVDGRQGRVTIVSDRPSLAETMTP